MSEPTNPQDLVAASGPMKGLHAGMGLAAKGMVLAFVIFTVLNVDFASSVFSTARSWIEASLSWYYILVTIVLLFVC